MVGYVGQVSLGHAALFGIGSYTAGVLYFHFGWTIWGTLPASIIVTSIFGGILALPALKVIGPYLAMVTLAFGTIAQILINEMTWLTGIGNASDTYGLHFNPRILKKEKFTEIGRAHV